MLSHLTIRNVAIIEEVVIGFDEGLNILSGETGAGKSIIIDSMNLVLGERADRELIRAGADSARVEAQFSLEADSPVRDALKETGADEDTVILSRELTASGRSVCRINGSLSTVTQLRELSSRLVDIHGQHEHQSLMNEANHIRILDAFGERTRELLARADGLYEAYRDRSERLEALRADERSRLQRIDVLDLQIAEIERARLQPGEEETLESRLRIAANLEKITSALAETHRLLYGGDGEAAASGLVGTARDRMDGVGDLDPAFGVLFRRLESVEIEIGDIAGEARGMLRRFEYDPGELAALEERLNALRVLEKKYGLTVEAVLTHLEGIRRQRDALLHSERTMTELEEEIARTGAQWRAAAGELTGQRRETAARIERAIEAQLHDLGMGGSAFRIEFERPDADGAPRRGGAETAAFRIATNPGEPPRPLGKTASGGELSRVMLALKNVLADSDRIPTMIFDEIDTGISGRMARVIAEKLNRVARSRQIICVTHTAQIAAMADTHFRIEKTPRDGRNITRVERMDEPARVQEISRLVGGTEISSKSVDHAREMLDWSRRHKLENR